MARNFDRTLLISSVLAAIGSFLIDLGNATNEVSTYIALKLQAMSIADRDFAVTALVVVIISAAVGLVVIQLLRDWRQLR